MRGRRLLVSLVTATIAALLLGQVVTVGAANAASGAMVDEDSCTQHELTANDDGSSDQVDLPFAINFYGHIRNKVWVNNNGNITFNGGLTTYTPFGLADTQEAIIAPFFADVDTRGSGSDTVKWGWGDLAYDNHRAFCVTWKNVGYYSAGTDKLNSFQLLLVDRSDISSGAFDIVFNYGQVQWETGSASGGVDGLGGSSAVAGFASGDGVAAGSIQLPGSAIPGSFLDSSPTALVKGKLGSNIPGRYVFTVRGDGVIGSQYVAMGDSFQSGEGAYNYDQFTADGNNKCHRSYDAYPQLLVKDQVVHLELNFRACSGAVMADLDQYHDDGKPPYDDGISQYGALGLDTKLVTIGIVGNDLDFAGTVNHCVITGIVSPTTPWVPACQIIFGGGVDDKLASLDHGTIGKALAAVYKKIKKLAPYARVIAVSYPKFFPAGGSLFCPTGIIRYGDQLWINDSIKKADSLIGNIAKANGVEYVNMATVTKDHEICSSVPAQNGVLLDANHDPLSESYHPNVLGHRFMADRIENYLDGPVVPTFNIQPLQTLSQYVAVTGRALDVAVNWPGSDVVTSLVSPSGVRYTRSDPQGAQDDVTPTSEIWRVESPEPGTWTLEFYGAQIAAGGEPVTVDTLDEHAPNVSPIASFTSAGAGRTYTFDASGSSDVDGSIPNYAWDFGDGTAATGKVVQHTFPADAQFQVMLAVTDDQGDSGFTASSKIVDTRNLQPAAVQRFASSAALTNTVTLGAPLEVDGDFECNSASRVTGDLVVTGNAHLTNTCRIDGSVWVGGSATLDSAPKVVGNFTANGSVRFQSTATIGGSIATGGSFVVTDGKSLASLTANHIVGGTITTNASLPVIAASPAVTTTFEAAATGSTPITWTKWMNQTATANAAPSWSQGLTASPGCTMASWSSSVNGSMVAVQTATVVDARSQTSGCATVTLQGMTVRLSADFTLVADSIAAVNGIQFRSTDGAAHRVRIIVPGTVASCATGKLISIPNGAAADSAISVNVFAPGKISLNGPVALKGTVIGGCWAGSGSVGVAP